LLAFAGGTQGSQEQIDIASVIEEAGEILRHALPKSIELHVDCETQLHPIAGDPTELSQVIMNLAINARDAMPDGGRLDLKAANFTVDEGRAGQSGHLKAGPHVLITVADEGTGIPKDILEQIFDPFFTTKEQGKGTGLGLAISLGIVGKHGGDLTVYSEIGAGTSFNILLPSTTISTIQPGFPADNQYCDGDGETVLLVDDDAMILEAARATLEASGYHVETALNGMEAIARIQRNEGPVDVIVLDMMMPGPDGAQSRDGIRAIRPDIPIIASSGLRRRGQTDGHELENFEAFLPKPYTDEQLLRAVAGVLGDKLE
jgi:CheY-like chemotaxis protein